MFNTGKRHIVLIGFSTLLAVFSLVSIVMFTDPYQSGWLTHVFLYASLYLAALGIFTVIGITAREFFLKGMYLANLSHSFRQAVLLSMLVTVSLFLQSQGLLYWWTELSLILLLASFEFFLSLKI